ncbi:MAG: glycine C-acetyltransferase [Rhodospirillaceae bacterium]|nr:MAG: glycine C-acetyltransferase [Rhodospirillaceae bacterium]
MKPTLHPMINGYPEITLEGSSREYREVKGRHALTRVAPFFDWQNERRQYGLWPYAKVSDIPPRTECAIRYNNGETIAGINFCSQDYLSLASHPAIKEATKAAAEEYGVHSAGSAVLLGYTKFSDVLKQKLREFLNASHIVLYPTGWGAAYGAITGLIHSCDHVVIDTLAHASLHEGAAAATRNIHLSGHRNNDAVRARRRLKIIRAQDAHNAIMVVTETLFSMDSDTPRIDELQEIYREYDAVLLVDVAHDLGVQKMLGKVDLVMGSFSKTFASNGGFIATSSRAVKEYLKFYSGTHTFSNALSPVQAAIVAQAIDLIRAPEGAERRQKLMDAVGVLRAELAAGGLECLGDPSAIVPVMIGNEGLSRVTAHLLPRYNVLANLVEYPAVAKGSARLRLQVQADHTEDQVRTAAAGIRTAVEEARGVLGVTAGGSCS